MRKYVLDSLQNDIDEIKSDLSDVRSDLDLGLADIRNSEGLPETPEDTASEPAHDSTQPVPFDTEAT